VAQTTLAIAPEVNVHEAVKTPHVTQRFEVVFKAYVAEQAKQYDELYPHQQPPVKAVHVDD